MLSKKKKSSEADRLECSTLKKLVEKMCKEGDLIICLENQFKDNHWVSLYCILA